DPIAAFHVVFGHGTQQLVKEAVLAGPELPDLGPGREYRRLPRRAFHPLLRTCPEIFELPVPGRLILDALEDEGVNRVPGLRVLADELAVLAEIPSKATALRFHQELRGHGIRREQSRAEGGRNEQQVQTEVPFAVAGPERC